MKRVCAWCRHEMGEKPGDVSLVTHGICDGCLDAVSANFDQDLQSFLDRFEAPIMMVDDDGVVLTANHAACTALCKDLDHVRGFRGGDVMECHYSRLPGGCGKTEHCVACTIRNTVMETHQSGKGADHRPAYQYIRTPEGSKKIRFTITTEKVNEMVFLRIDEQSEVLLEER